MVLDGVYFTQGQSKIVPRSCESRYLSHALFIATLLTISSRHLALDQRP